MIRQLEFAAPFVYSTRGTSVTSQRSRVLRSRIKGGDQALFSQIAAHIAELVRSGAFAGYFTHNTVLVPVPGHAPLAPGAVLLTARIAVAMTREALAPQIEPLIERATPVAKSAFVAPADRPAAITHYNSLIVRRPLLIPERILLVDDVVTRGAMLIASASRLSAAFPAAEIRGFAVLRAITEGDIQTIREPCQGTIELLSHGETQRRP